MIKILPEIAGRAPSLVAAELVLVRRMKRIVAALSLCALPSILAMTPDEFAETTQRVVGLALAWLLLRFGPG